MIEQEVSKESDQI